MGRTILDYNQIQKILPQQYPFALIDRVVDFQKGESLVAIKNITVNEWPFSALGAAPVTSHRSQVQTNSADGASRFTLAHSQSAFPLTLLIESAAQAALILYQLSMVAEGDHPKYVLGRVKAEFFGEARVGASVEFRVSKGKMMVSGGYSDVQVYSGDKKVAELTLIYSVSRSKGI